MTDCSSKPFRFLVAVPAILALAIGCGRPLHTGEAGGELAAVLYFTNESIDQAAVYAVGSGISEIRIGTVMAGRTETLTVPPSLINGANGVRLFVRPLGRSFTAASEPLSLRPGDELAVRLTPDQRSLVILPPK